MPGARFGALLDHRMMRGVRALAVLAAFVMLTGATAMDPDNPTCPAQPDFGPKTPMTLKTAQRGGKRVLLAEGAIRPTLPTRLKAAIEADDRIEEIWLRSPSTTMSAPGNEAGRIIRSYRGMLTRVPSGWTCFSACNFVFIGGDRRVIDDGGVFMVHMFTHTNDRALIDEVVIEGSEATTELITSIEQSSAMLASEDNDFLIRMGISRKLLTDIMYKQQAVKRDGNPSTRYCLSQAEVRE